MNNEKLKILEMLENGKLNAQEAAQLLDALGSGDSSRNEAAVGGPPATGKKLRVIVKGDTDKEKNMNVNVSMPLSLARLVDNVVENCIPTEALSELKNQGIDLKALKISDMIGTLESLDEDIVNADIDSENAKLKVRVYVD